MAQNFIANGDNGLSARNIINNNFTELYIGYSTVQSNSATNWNYQGTDLKGLSSSWVGGNSAYTTVYAKSANWDAAFGSAGADAAVRALTASWVGGNSAYTTVQSNSATWNSVYTTVQSNSALYATVSFTNSKFLPLSGGTVSGNISASGNIAAESSTIPVTVTDIIADKTFANVDTNKVFHFSTSSPLTAIFPSTLSDGFSVAIMNTGTSTLHLSTNGTYKAIGDVITDQYAGAYVYKANSEIFAVGGL